MIACHRTLNSADRGGSRTVVCSRAGAAMGRSQHHRRRLAAAFLHYQEMERQRERQEEAAEEEELEQAQTAVLMAGSRQA